MVGKETARAEQREAAVTAPAEAGVMVVMGLARQAMAARWVMQPAAAATGGKETARAVHTAAEATASVGAGAVVEMGLA